MVVVVVINFEQQFVANSMLVPFVFLLSRIAAAISAITDSYGKFQLNKPASIEMLSYNKLLLENNLILDARLNVNGKHQMRNGKNPCCEFLPSKYRCFFFRKKSAIFFLKNAIVCIFLLIKNQL